MAGPDTKRKPRKERTALPVGIIQKTIKQLNKDLTADDAQTDPDKKMDTRHRISTANSLEKLCRLLLINDRRGREGTRDKPKNSSGLDWNN
jgi:hypothetical protein